MLPTYVFVLSLLALIVSSPRPNTAACECRPLYKLFQVESGCSLFLLRLAMNRSVLRRIRSPVEQSSKWVDAAELCSVKRGLVYALGLDTT